MIDRVGLRKRFVRWAVILLLLIHAWMLAYAATQHSPTMLEPGFLVSGISHWQFGRFELFRVNPPLVRLVAALPVMAAGCRTDWSRLHDRPGTRVEFWIGRDFVRANGERCVWLFTLARWACIPFSLVGGLFCFLWARELWGCDLAGLLATALWCFEPNVLAHGELITSDCAAASLGLAAGYFFWRWLRRPSWRRALGAGLALGLAELTKMTLAVLFLVWPVLWLAFRRGAKHSRESRVESRELDEASRESRARKSAERGSERESRRPVASLAQLALIVLLGVYLINVAYAFEGTFTKLGDFTFVSRTLAGADSIVDGGQGGNRFAQHWLGRIPIPLPSNYVGGVDVQKADFERGAQSYLLGQWQERGWWYYYLVCAALKLPHGTQLLFLAAVVSAVASRGRRIEQKSHGKLSIDN